MENYDEIAAVMSRTTGKDVEYDECKGAYVLFTESGEEIVFGYTDEDIIEVVDTLLRM